MALLTFIIMAPWFLLGVLIFVALLFFSDFLKECFFNPTPNPDLHRDES